MHGKAMDKIIDRMEIVTADLSNDVSTSSMEDIAGALMCIAIGLEEIKIELLKLTARSK